MRALQKDAMDGDERLINTMVWCEIFGYAYPYRYAHISLSYCHILLSQHCLGRYPG